MEVERSKYSTYLTITIIIAVIWLLSNQSQIHRLQNENQLLQSENEDLQSENNNLQDQVSEYDDALQEANDLIENAQYQAWSSYEEMGNALDDLYTISAP